jgi:hypothetical protein
MVAPGPCFPLATGMTGYTVNTASLAIRVGELSAVADQVGTIVGALDLTGGDIGPGDIAAAVAEVAGEWRDNLDGMRDKIETIAGNVRGAVANYEVVEQGGYDRMRALAEGTVRDAVFETLRGARP